MKKQLTKKDMLETLKLVVSDNVYKSLEKKTKEEVTSFYNSMRDFFSDKSTDITSKENNKKQRNKQKAVKDNYFNIKDFIVCKKNKTHGGIQFNFDIEGYIPKKVFNGIVFSLKSLKDDKGNKVCNYDVDNKLWIFDLKNKDIINKWYKNQINYKKGGK